MPEPLPDPAAELERLRAGLGALEARLARVEGLLRLPAPRAPAPAGPGPGPDALRPRAPADRAADLPGPHTDWAAAPALAGRLLLVLAGAFLLRAASEAGRLPLAAGAALGLAYAAGWLLAADRAGAGGRRAGALVDGVGAALVALPLLAETTLRFQLLPPAATAALLGVVALAGLRVARRRDVQGLAWAFGAGTALVALALLPRPGGALPGAALLVLLAAWARRAAASSGWTLLPWPAALVADGAVSFLTTAAAGGRVPLPLAAVLAVPLLLSALTLAPAVAAALGRGRALPAFDVSQSAAAVVVGYGGALRLAQGHAGAQASLAAAGLLLGVGAYVAAFRWVPRERRGPFLTLTSLALALVLLSSPALLSEPSAAWSALAVGTALAGSRSGRVVLCLHAAVYAGGAALASGLLGLATTAWSGTPGPAWPAPGAAQLLALLGALVLAAAPHPRDNPWWRGAAALPRVLGLALSVGAGGGAVLALLAPGLLASGGLSSADGGGAALLALLRTGVLSGATLGVAALARRDAPRAARVLVPVLLALGLVKLALEDLRAGQPATMGLSLLLYGAALIVAPRLARGRAPAQGGPAQGPPLPSVPRAPGDSP